MSVVRCCVSSAPPAACRAAVTPQTSARRTRAAAVTSARLSRRRSHRGPSAVFAEISRYGAQEDLSDGRWMQTFGFPTSGGKIGKELLKFGAGSEAIPVTLARPLGIVFEEEMAAGSRRCVVVELVEGGNAESSGEVEVGDILRVTTAVAKTADKVSVGRFQVEPSLSQRQQGGHQLAYFVADDQPFGSVMGALTSFSNPVDTEEGQEEVATVSMLLERPAKA